MKVNKNIFVYIGIVFFSCSCNKLDQLPKSTVTKDAVFNSERGLELYISSLYDILPDAGGIMREDNMADYTARREVPEFIRLGAYSPRQSTGWDWEHLRNINYFIANCNNESISLEIRNHYIGIARFFRAFFYFEKVKRFGDVPWVSEPFDIDNERLFSGRDSREVVIDEILNDIDFAIENITMLNDASRTLITKYVALALKSRICLFEGTFRKYHTNYDLTESVDFLLQEGRDAAKIIIDESGFSLNINPDPNMSYRQVFTSLSPISSEVILANQYNDALSVYHDANWYWTSATYGDRASLTRTFINTYLYLDGTSFTDDPDYKKTVFTDEVKDRDLRLSQTIRTPGYTRVNGGVAEEAPPLFSYTFTGYQPIKWTLDDFFYDSGQRNDNTIPIFRYAEILLNYAETLAELGVLTDSDWSNTIGQLRSRAGITDGLASKPTQVDRYLQSVYFEDIADPAILEIRRERGIELVFEGFRFYDLVRWKKGELMEQKWNGMYVPSLNTPIDLNGDGVLDVAFYTGSISNQLSGVTYINVSPSIGGGTNPYSLTQGTSGEINWLNNVSRIWNDKFYLYPIPEADRLINPNLGQNPGWQE